MAHVPNLSPDELARRWQLVTEHRERLLRIALSRAGNVADAEDVVQEAMVRCVAFEDLDEARVSSLLTTLTLRLCVDQHRQRSRELRAGTAVFHGVLDEAGPEETVCDREEAAWATKVAAALPERQWEALTLKARGADVAETARRMHLSYKAVESALSRARSVVRLRLASTLGALVCFLRRSKTVAVPLTTATLAGVTAAVVVGSIGQPATPDAELPWRVAAPVSRDSRPDVVPATVADGRDGGHGRSVKAVALPARARTGKSKGRPHENDKEVVRVDSPIVDGPIGVTHGTTDDSLSQQVERCATSYTVEQDENGKLYTHCKKQPGDPGAYPISDLLEEKL